MLIEDIKNNLDPSKLKDLYTQNNADWEEINLFGFRNEDSPQEDIFNDLIGICVDTPLSIPLSVPILRLYQGTTDPSRYFTEHPVTYEGVTGAAHLMNGWHKNGWQVGMHSPNTAFHHLALIQTGADVNFWRDTNKNYEYDPGVDVIQSGFVGIDIHRAGLDDPVLIGLYSAGCQVIRKHEEQQEMMQLIQNSLIYKNNNSFRFSYLLMNTENINI